MSETLRGIDRIKVSREKLLERVRENYEQHKKDHAVAYRIWKSELLDAVHTVSAVVEKEDFTLQNLEDAIANQSRVVYEKPRDCTSYYDGLISQLEMSEDQFLEISAQEFRAIWNNQTHTEYLHNNTKYSSVASL